MEKWRARSALRRFRERALGEGAHTHTHHTHPAVIVLAREVSIAGRNCPCRDRTWEFTLTLAFDFYSPVFCAIIGSIASNTTRKIGVILTTFFPAFPRPPVITAHLTPPSQRATYEKINHLRHKHTTFITVRGRGQNRSRTTRCVFLRARTLLQVRCCRVNLDEYSSPSSHTQAPWGEDLFSGTLKQLGTLNSRAVQRE